MDIYKIGEEKNRFSKNAYKNVFERVSYALSSSILMDLSDQVPTLEERIRFFFEDFYFDNVPTSSRTDIRYYITAFKRFIMILKREKELEEDEYSSFFSVLSEYL